MKLSKKQIKTNKDILDSKLDALRERTEYIRWSLKNDPDFPTLSDMDIVFVLDGYVKKIEEYSKQLFEQMKNYASNAIK